MENTRRAVQFGDYCAQMGLYPFIPHLTLLWELIQGGHDYDFWLDQDRTWVEKCDCLFRLPGVSPGGDKEVAWAEEMGIPVFYNAADLNRWAQTKVQHA